MNMTDDEVLVQTRRWLERAVIGLNLCPFAKSVYVKNQVRLVVNALIRRYGHPTEVVVELARDLKQSREQKAETQKKQSENQRRNERIRGEVEDASLARCYPDFEALCADGRFEHLAQTLYAALAEWVATHVDATPHGETDALHAPEEAAQ